MSKVIMFDWKFHVKCGSKDHKTDKKHLIGADATSKLLKSDPFLTIYVVSVAYLLFFYEIAWCGNNL